MQRSLLTDLTKSKDELLNQITSKNFKYEIRRSNRDEITVKYYTAQDILKNPLLLDKFKICYDQMFAEKGKSTKLNLEALKRYAEESALIISVVYFDEEPVVFHSYVDGKDRVRFFHSCSTFRSDREYAQLIGRANKRLHWEDWLYFKDKGYVEYDWGGVFAFDSDDGIDKFKRTFGGKPVEYFNVSVSGSILGRLSEFVMNLRK